MRRSNMSFRKIIGIVLVFIIMTLVTSCGEKISIEEKKTSEIFEKTIVVPIEKEPNIINMAFAAGKEDILVSNIVYSPLYIYEKGKTRNYLAQKIEFKDCEILTIQLKKNLKWHDGKSITSEDLIFTINSVVDEKQGSPLRKYLLIEGKAIKVEKIDDLSVKITLPTPNAEFLYGMSKIYPIPKHIFEIEGLIVESEKNNFPIGSGPFKFKECKIGESILLERYDEYFGGKPKALGVEIKIIPSEASQEVILNNGELTLMRSKVEFFENAKKNAKLQTYTYSEGKLNYIVFNQNKAYMKNEKFRKALSKAFNRKKMIKDVYGREGAVEASSIFVPEADFYINDVERYDYNLDEAKELFRESGVSLAKLRIGYNTLKINHEIYATFAAKQLNDLGIQGEIVPYEDKNFFYILFSSSPACDMYVNSYSLGLGPNAYRDMFKTGEYGNQTNYSNIEVDKLWDMGIAEIDLEKRRLIYEEIQRLIAEDAPIYTIEYEENFMVAQVDLRGIEEAKPKEGILFEDWSKLYLI